MAAEVVAVLLEGRHIGEVERLAGGGLRLRYHESYRSSGAVAPLSVSMPLDSDVHGRVIAKSLSRAQQ